jgi:FKBP-type peptidyl-prolyl cis-trans isomerase SlpA
VRRSPVTEQKKVAAGSTISLRYALSLADGTVIEETGEEPETLTLGEGEFINELEQKLYGLGEGESDDIIIPAIENLFGTFEEERVQHLDPDVFDEHEPPQAGHVIEFSLPNGTTVPGIIREVTGDHVLVDFNHPLCGKDLMFAVEIVSIK